MVPAEQFSQAIQCSLEGVMRSIAIGIRPQGLAEALDTDITATQSHKRLQQVDRPTLRFATEANRLIVEQYRKSAQRINLEVVRPCFQLHRISGEMVPADQFACMLSRNVLPDRSLTQPAQGSFRTPGQVGIPMALDHSQCFAQFSSRGIFCLTQSFLNVHQ